MEFMVKYVKILLTDPVLGPKIVLLQLFAVLFSIAALQGINADLWTDSGMYGPGVAPIAEVGK